MPSSRPESTSKRDDYLERLACAIVNLIIAALAAVLVAIVGGPGWACVMTASIIYALGMAVDQMDRGA